MARLRVGKHGVCHGASVAACGHTRVCVCGRVRRVGTGGLREGTLLRTSIAVIPNLARGHYYARRTKCMSYVQVLCMCIPCAW